MGQRWINGFMMLHGGTLESLHSGSAQDKIYVSFTVFPFVQFEYIGSIVGLRQAV